MIHRFCYCEDFFAPIKALVVFIAWFAGAAIGSQVHGFIKKIHRVALHTLQMGQMDYQRHMKRNKSEQTNLFRKLKLKA
jgi:hypothetical protein